jgi:zinc protease
MANNRRSWVTALIALALVAACDSTSSAPPSGPSPNTSAAPSTNAPPAPEPTGDNTPIGNDPAVRVGTLDNGLTYYLRENDTPNNRLSARLVIGSGSAQEADDQRGGAHYLEHMLFNGTAKYPGNEVDDVVARLGGEHNAYTTYDRMVYELDVPAKTDTNVAAAAEIMFEMLTAATLSDDEVERERGVILEEMRTYSGDADDRIGTETLELLLRGTPYEDRDPIGAEASVKAMTPAALRRYYDDWYRPDNAAIIMVGNIDLGAAEELITEQFAAAASRGSAPPRKPITVPPLDDSAAAVITDPEATSSTVSLLFSRPAVPTNTVGAVRNRLADVVAAQILSQRFADDVDSGEGPFLGAYAGPEYSPLEGVDLLSVVAEIDAAQAEDAANALAVELERVRRFGVTDDELRRAVDEIRSLVDQHNEGWETTDNADRVEEYVDHFMTSTAFPSPDQNGPVVIEALGDITAETAAETLTGWTAYAPQLVVAAPEDDADQLPSEDELLAIVKAAADADIENRESSEPTKAAALMTPPSPVEEMSREELTKYPEQSLDPTQFTFPNGLRVVLNPTDITKGQIRIYGYSQGGLSLVSDDDVGNARMMDEVAGYSGLGDLDRGALDEALNGTQLTYSGSITSTNELVNVSGPSTSFEGALQLVHLMMTQQRFEDRALERVRKEWVPLLENIDNDSEEVLERELRAARYPDNTRYAQNPTTAELETLDPARMERLWQERFGNPSDFVITISGDFSLDDGASLIRTYLGSIPDSGEPEAWSDFTGPVPAGAVIREVSAGTGDEATLVVRYEAPAPLNGDEFHPWLLGRVLEKRLVDTIREELGATYSPSAWVNWKIDPNSRYTARIDISGAPASMTRIAELVHGEIADLRSTPISDEELAEAVGPAQQNACQLSDVDRVNDYLSFDANQAQDHIARFIDCEQRIDAITPSVLQAVAAAAFPDGQYIQVTVLPSAP